MYGSMGGARKLCSLYPIMRLINNTNGNYPYLPVGIRIGNRKLIDVVETVYIWGFYSIVVGTAFLRLV